eukprot:19259-Alexandrium_andersonii.AAC.1
MEAAAPGAASRPGRRHPPPPAPRAPRRSHPAGGRPPRSSPRPSRRLDADPTAARLQAAGANPAPCSAGGRA